jgi:hypothetical protein
VEALLAACLLEAGETAPQSLLKWLNLPILKSYTSSSTATNNSSNNSSSNGSGNGNDSNGSSSTGSSFLDTGIASSFVTPTKAPVVSADSTTSAENSDAMDVELVQTEPAGATTTSNANRSDEQQQQLQQQQQQSSSTTHAVTEAVTDVNEVVKEKKVRYYPAVNITTPSEWALRGRPGLTVTSLERQLQVLVVYD